MGKIICKDSMKNNLIFKKCIMTNVDPKLYEIPEYYSWDVFVNFQNAHHIAQFYDTYDEIKQQEYLRHQMQIIYDGIIADVDVTKYNDYTRFDVEQMTEVLKGLMSGVDVTQYNDPARYNEMQMRAVRLGLVDGLDVSLYNNPEVCEAHKMHLVLLGLQLGLDVERYNHPDKYSWEEMHTIYQDERYNKLYACI